MNKIAVAWAGGAGLAVGLLIGRVTAPQAPRWVVPAVAATQSSDSPADGSKVDPAFNREYERAMDELRAERDSAEREAEQAKRRADENDEPPGFWNRH